MMLKNVPQSFFLQTDRNLSVQTALFCAGSMQSLRILEISSLFQTLVDRRVFSKSFLALGRPFPFCQDFSRFSGLGGNLGYMHTVWTVMDVALYHLFHYCGHRHCGLFFQKQLSKGWGFLVGGGVDVMYVCVCLCVSMCVWVSVYLNAFIW